MRYTLEIQKLLYQIEDNKNLTPKDKVKLFKQAADIADSNDDIEWGYDIRLQLIRECFALASGTELVTEFTWILNAYESHPDWFDENDFLWEYKWVLGELYRNHEVPLEQINTIMEDFKTRLQRNGFSLQPYYDRLFDEYTILEEPEKAGKYLKLRKSVPNDDMGNCPACLLDGEIDYLLLTDKFDEANHRSQPLIDKQIGCTHVPARTFCTLFYYANKIGNKKEAARYYDLAEEIINKLIDDNDESMCTSVGRMICYLFETDEKKAWYYLEKSLPWSFESNPYTRYKYYLYVYEGLLKYKGESINLDLPDSFAPYNKDNVYRIDELITYFKYEASLLAEAFDKRNGCNVFTKQLMLRIKS